MVSREAVLAKASSWVGMQERSGNNDIWFADDWGITGQSWCFAFVQSCFYYADPSPTGALPHQSMYCPYGIQWARDNGQSIEVGGAPAPGDIVFFSWDMGNWGRWTPGTGDHVGIVEGWDGGDTIWTIEGNVGSPQGVYRKVRSISETVVCFWRPTVYDGSLGPAAAPAPTGAPDGNNVRYMQQFLTDRGMNPGPVDGELGPMTAGGVTRWQQALSNGGFNPGPIDGDWGPLTTAATAAWLAAGQTAAPAPVPEEDMTPEQAAKQDAILAAVAELQGHMIPRTNWILAGLAAGITFVRDGRDGKTYMVYGTTFKRWMKNADELGGFQNHWAVHNLNVDIVDWSPVHIDSLIDVEDLALAARAAANMGAANAATLDKVYALAKGELPEPPPAEKVVDVEASLAQATPGQLLDALKAAFGAPGPKPPVVAPNDPA